MLRVGGHTWTASYGLFDRVPEVVADTVGDPVTAATLRSVVENRLGYLAHHLGHLAQRERVEARRNPS